MTIKQLGGVFGRNPTFNDVTIEGQLTFDGDIDVGSDLKIDGDLNVIGTTTLDGPVDVNMGNNIVDFSSGDSGYIKIQHVSRGGDYRLKVNGATADYLDVQNGASQKLIRMAATGDVTIYDNLVIGTSGNGIDFSATAGTGTSELFDDYEEGTFTPNLEDDAGNNYTGTYGYQEGSYTKIGNSVRFTLRIYADQSLTGNGLTGSEVLRIKDLPFIHANDNIGTGIAINNGGNFNYDAGYTQALSVVASNKSYIIFRQLGDSVTANNLTVTKCDSIGGITGFYAFVSGVYVV